MTTTNKLSARQQNLKQVLTLLDNNDELSAKKLSSLTGLSIVSVNKLLDILISKSKIIATDYLNTRGRRAKIYKMNYEAISLGIVQLVEDKNQIKATYFLTDLLGNIKYKKFNNKRISSIEQLTNFIHQQTNLNKPSKIIIGIPGAELDGYLQISDVKSLSGINLSLAIETATNIETIVANDANAGTFGGAIKLHQNEGIAVGIYFPNNFGPGVGIVINNHLINGADGLAGEIEYSTVNKNLNITDQITQHIQNIISLLNPNLIIAYVDKLSLPPIQIDQIKQTIQRNLPLYQKYQLDFNRKFENDYLIGLAAIGRKNILRKLATD
ncbi:ROK family protein [Companilactobacillus nuruki]|uniref:Transcriptional regulator n=1 Tax=Companilactobacillus nuruki TaxID=1993540 RepID=A0A2N7AR48_9LACO|nr:ROK family protein [Companilactobacillus nuruki]PMD67840.1 hypothetical protein CBP76_12120 [Companilactobacillus nuruki]